MFCVQSNGSFTGSTNTFVSLSVDDDVLKTECNVTRKRDSIILLVSMVTVLLGNAPGGNMRSSISRQLLSSYNDICYQQLLDSYNK